MAASMAATPKLVFRLNDTGDSFDGGVLTQFVLPYMMGGAAIFRIKSFIGSLHWIGVRQSHKYWLIFVILSSVKERSNLIVLTEFIHHESDTS
jgi:hypothetical protein